MEERITKMAAAAFPCLSYACSTGAGNIALLWMYSILSMLVNTNGQTQSWDYTYYRALDYEGKYILGWRHNDTDIEFEVTVQTLGYVGFGISRTGDMYPADIMIGWISEGNMYLGVCILKRFRICLLETMFS